MVRRGRTRLVCRPSPPINPPPWLPFATARPATPLDSIIRLARPTLGNLPSGIQ